MLLMAFKSYELSGDTTLADQYFEEALSLEGIAGDFYGHVEMRYEALRTGKLSTGERALRLASRLADAFPATIKRR